MEAHNGAVEFENRPEGGVSFTLRDSCSGGSAMIRRRILLVEDEPGCAER
jgi:hypothetical protein